MDELTPNGFINPKMKAKTFINAGDTFSPVIRFRWGYKASSDELQEFGDGIYLNEENYWGGGPFANGCSTLPDLWGKGLSDELFLFLHIQHLNPTNDRNVFACPPRPYYVLAALRLAKLVATIRQKQADVPITIVCHSQGNMVGMAAAFLGDAMSDVTDGVKSGRCVADTYVLCNPPYSLVENNMTESWTQRSMEDETGKRGRQTSASRRETLAAFFDILRKQASKQQAESVVDNRMSNEAHDFTAKADRGRYGLNGSTHGRVTLYCNPHDQVISASAVQGIGWRGMSDLEINGTRGDGVFTQRVFAQGWPVGQQGYYDYWRDQYNAPVPGEQTFWQPESPKAEYCIGKGLAANKHWYAKFFTVVASPLMYVGIWAAHTRVNALPPSDKETWKIHTNAPALPLLFKPQAVKLGVSSLAFDQGFDAPGTYRNPMNVRQSTDPYTTVTKSEVDGHTDVAVGNESSEASLAYENHAYLRMEAKREHLYGNGEKVTAEDDPNQADGKYSEWHNKKTESYLVANIDAHATDHSTIMTNPMHAEMALAYDVAIGTCDISGEAMHQFRMAADWRFLQGLDNSDPNKIYFEYFQSGLFKGTSVYSWANVKGGEGARPKSIKDERQWDSAPAMDGKA